MNSSGGVLTIIPITEVGEIAAGTDLGAVLVAALRTQGTGLNPGDVVLVSSKVVSKALGLTRPSANKADVVAQESVRIVAERATTTGVTQIVEAAAGPVMAAAGVDASNTGPSGHLLVLPHDPDAEADRLRAALIEQAGLPEGTPLAVVLTDTAGRPWRAGQTDFALGSAGLQALLDHRGGQDHDGRALHVTAVAVADELAAAADLVKGKAAGIPAALARGIPDSWLVTGPDHGAVAARSAGSLVRRGAGDWFALGHREAVRAALGIAPGSPAALEVGVPPLGSEDFADTLVRVLASALGSEADVGADVELTGAAHAEITLTSPDGYALGRAAARLEVAAAGEGLHCALPDDLPANPTALIAHLTVP